MKKTFTLTVLLLACLFCKAQNLVTIPDTYFASYLQNVFPNCMTNGNQLDTTCPDVLNARVLSIGIFVQDATGYQYFKNADTLYMNGAYISGLPFFPSKLTYMEITNCNSFINCPPFPSTLKHISITNNSQLYTLPDLPAGLDTLDCNDNQLLYLPSLPASLIALYCGGNSLTSLPALPNSLERVWCDVNQLTSLPALPLNLKEISCTQNQITALPSFPDGIVDVIAWQNNLTAVPPIPANSMSGGLNVSINQITSLPALPDSMAVLGISYNPIACLPPIHKIGYLTVTHTLITCLPDSMNVQYSDTIVSNYPLCSSLKSNPCAVSTGEVKIPPATSSVSVFPNPSNGNFTITIPAEINNGVVEIYNVMGERVSNIKYQDMKFGMSTPDSYRDGGKGVEMNINLVPGIYFVRVSGGGKQFNQKLIISK